MKGEQLRPTANMSACLAVSSHHQLGLPIGKVTKRMVTSDYQNLNHLNAHHKHSTAQHRVSKLVGFHEDLNLTKSRRPCRDRQAQLGYRLEWRRTTAYVVLVTPEAFVMCKRDVASFKSDKVNENSITVKLEAWKVSSYALQQTCQLVWQFPPITN